MKAFTQLNTLSAIKTSAQQLTRHGPLASPITTYF